MVLFPIIDIREYRWEMLVIRLRDERANPKCGYSVGWSIRLGVYIMAVEYEDRVPYKAYFQITEEEYNLWETDPVALTMLRDQFKIYSEKHERYIFSEINNPSMLLADRYVYCLERVDKLDPPTIFEVDTTKFEGTDFLYTRNKTNITENLTNPRVTFKNYIYAPDYRLYDVRGNLTDYRVWQLPDWYLHCTDTPLDAYVNIRDAKKLLIKKNAFGKKLLFVKFRDDDIVKESLVNGVTLEEYDYDVILTDYDIKKYLKEAKTFNENFDNILVVE